MKTDLGDGEIKIKFSKRMNWSAKPALTVTEKDGKVLEVASLRYAATEIKAKVVGMKAGGEYRYTVTDPSGKTEPISGRFILQESHDGEHDEND